MREGRRDWFRIENLADGTRASVYIYDEIGYWGVTAQDFVAELSKCNVDNIDLHISSPGGEVYDGIAILEALRQHRASITTYVDSLAASAASFIAMAGDRIVMGRNAEMMIHDAMSLCIGNAAEMRAWADRLDAVSDNIASVYAERGTGDKAFWRAQMRKETWYSAEEAVAAGLADEIQGITPNDSIPRNKWDLSIFQHAGRDQAPTPVMPDTQVIDFSVFASQLRDAVGKGK